MATRTVQLGITVGVPDPDKSDMGVMDAEGRYIRQPKIGCRMVPPGEPVELDAEEADRLEARYPYRPMVVIDPAAPVVTTMGKGNIRNG